MEEDVTQLDVILEAIRYIASLQGQLVARAQAGLSPDTTEHVQTNKATIY
jgi:hypothetical protein